MASNGKSRATWTGAISFGLVNIPVGLHSTTTTHDIKFKLFDAGTTDGVKMPRVNERTGVPVTATERGIEWDNKLVKVTDEELEAVTPENLKTIEIVHFVQLGDIDPIYFRGSYFVSPKDAGAQRGYHMLRQAMETSGRVAIGKFVMRSKEYLVAIRPLEGALVLNQLWFEDEVKRVHEVVGDVGADISDKELSMANMLIDQMVTEWDPNQYHDEYHYRVEALLDAKAAGITPTIEQKPAAPATDDLMAALEASLKEAS
jgi:DNA end-binding protein Ku